MSPPTLRTMMISDKLRRPRSARTETAISENASSVPIIQRMAAAAFDCFGGEAEPSRRRHPTRRV